MKLLAWWHLATAELSQSLHAKHSPYTGLNILATGIMKRSFHF